MLMAPNAAMPVERSKFAVEIWNSCTTSCEKFWPVPPSIGLRMFPPSTVIAVRDAGAPSTETLNCALNCAGLARVTVTPGCSAARFMKLRPFSGRFSIWVRPTTPCTRLDSRSTCVAVPVTVIASVRALTSSDAFTVVVAPVVTSTGVTIGWNPGAMTSTS
jgi:hypothetical protein